MTVEEGGTIGDGKYVPVILPKVSTFLCIVNSRQDFNMIRITTKLQLLSFLNYIIYEWKKCWWSVVERWIEEMILTLARQSQRLSHMCTWKISGVLNGIRRFESRWRHLKNFRCIYETIPEIVQQVWGSLLQFIFSMMETSWKTTTNRSSII